ncbi:MAG: cold shock domain-containing protein [Rhodospirillaceae bacterium]|nr:cold shock domain-containing protein [Rhodospirillaceae bacterium]
MESSPQAGSEERGVTAKVKWFNPTKGFGFVAPTDGTPDAFLHVSVVHKAGLRTLRQGATLNCALAEGPKGPQVTVIEDVDNSTVVDDVPEGDESVIDGEIKFFAADKGYGFGVPLGGGDDIFIGIGALQRSDLDRLESGQHVKMHVQDGAKGPMATQVEIISDAPPPSSEDTNE